MTSYLPTVSTADYEEPSWFDYRVTIFHRWSKDEELTFSPDDYEEMLEVFDRLRPLYFRHEYSKSSQEPTLKYIIEDCQELAKLYTCYLDISLSDNSAKLLSVRQGSVEYAKYKLFTESEDHECYIKDLISDIKRCAARKYNKDTRKFNKLAYDAVIATMKFLRTI